MKIVLATGGFDPLHSGHIEYLKESRKLGGMLVVGLNSNDWLIRKKGKFFLEWEERASIIEELKCVSKVISFDDSDGTANDAIRIVMEEKFSKDKVIFANGGDRNYENIPELEAWYDKGVIFHFGVGGFEKKNSSSLLLKRWEQ